jgi:hypothetical protein
MRSRDVVKIFESVGVGTQVEILEKPIKQVLREQVTMSWLARNFQNLDN